MVCTSNCPQPQEIYVPGHRRWQHREHARVQRWKRVVREARSATANSEIRTAVRGKTYRTSLSPLLKFVSKMNKFTRANMEGVV